MSDLSALPPSALQSMLGRDDPDLTKFRHWKPDVQQQALDLLKERLKSEFRPFYCPDVGCSGRPHVLAVDGNPICPTPRQGCHPLHQWVDLGGWCCEWCMVDGIPQDEWLHSHARKDQRPPRWNDPWSTWLFLAGRGVGKSLTGSHVQHRIIDRVETSVLIGPTTGAIREVMVEGPTGILATAPPNKRPLWSPANRKLTWPNGATALCFSGEEPDRLRGGNPGHAWVDEPAFIPLINDVWSNLKLSLRDGKNPKIIATTTPTPIKWLKSLIAAPGTILTRVATRDNLHNLSPTYYRDTIQPMEGTRIGRQELDGELLEDVEGSLWKREMFQYIDEADLPDFRRIVVSIDPAGSANRRSDETGIIVLGLHILPDGSPQIILMEDATGKYSPDGWATKADQLVRKWKADCIVAEKNYGGDMVKSTLEKKTEARIKLVHSRRGKELRAEPFVARYERGEVLHLRGAMQAYEDEACEWVPGHGASPNRIDAAVHGGTELGNGHRPSSAATATGPRGPGRRAPINKHLYRR